MESIMYKVLRIRYIKAVAQLCSHVRRRTLYVIPNTSYVNPQRGFTIIESIVLVFVFVMIVGAIVVSLSYTYRGQRFAFEQADATRSARTGMERMVQNLREASSADNGAYPIISMGTSSIEFYSDYDNDSKIERLHYFLDGTDIKRGIVESAGDPPTYATSTEVVSTVSQYVRNEDLGVPLFTLYDKDGALMSDYNEIDELAFVILRVVVNLHPERAPDDYELRTSAALRNVE